MSSQTTTEEKDFVRVKKKDLVEIINEVKELRALFREQPV